MEKNVYYEITCVTGIRTAQEVRMKQQRNVVCNPIILRGWMPYPLMFEGLKKAHDLNIYLKSCLSGQERIEPVCQPQIIIVKSHRKA